MRAAVVIVLLFLSAGALALLFSSTTLTTSPPPLLPHSATATTPSPPSPSPLPRLLHFAYCRPESNASALSFAHWVGMTSAVAQLRPARILVHTEVGALPFGFWWDQFVEAHRDLLQVVEHDPVTAVYGHPVQVLAHKTDVLRLDALYNHGGVYLDSDVLVFHDFLSALNDHLRLHPEQDAVLAQERNGSESFGNAVIVARPFSKFIALWKRNYRDFDDHQWSTHSTALPRKLAQSEPGASLLHQLPAPSFYHPDWDEVLSSVGRQLFFDELRPGEKGLYDFEAAGALGWHWWGHRVSGQLGTWTPCLLLAQADKTVISRLMGRYVNADLCQRWRASQEAP